MKKSLLYTLLALAGLSACNKGLDDTVFDKTSDARLDAVLQDYQAKLSGAPNGWKLVIAPADTNYRYVYFFWNRFGNNNRVISRYLAQPALESSFRLKAMQRPELIFDTYTYLHDLSNPVPAVPGALTGKGLSADFEFEILSGNTDSFVLKGKYNGSDAKLYKATPTDSANSATLATAQYPLAGTYAVKGRALFYTGSTPTGTPSTVAIPAEKRAVPLTIPNTVGVEFSNQTGNGWLYRITFDPATSKITSVVPSPTLANSITAGSFKVLDYSYDASLKQIFLKTSYINTAGAYRDVEETLTLK